MKLIFLDIDGVLNNPGTWSPEPPRHSEGLLRVPVAPECVAAFNRLVELSGAKIVISSSWRMFAQWQDLGPALLRHGVMGEIIGETPRPDHARDWLLGQGYDLDDALPHLYERGMDIWAWLAQNVDAYSMAFEPIEGFVILDDGSDMWRLMDALVLTDGSQGMQETDVEIALGTFEDSRAALETIWKVHA